MAIRKSLKDVLISPFVTITLLFLLTAKGHIEIIDTEYSIRTAKAIIEDGTMLIEPVSVGVNHIPLIEGTNKIYSQYGIGLLVIFIPIIMMAKFACFCFGLEEVMLSHFLLSFYNIPFALLGLWHFREILKKLGQDHHVANFLMICLATGTIFWKYVVTDFSEVTQISLLLGAIHSYIKRENPNRWLFVSGYLSLLILLKIVYVIILPPFVVLAVIEGGKQKKVVQYLLQGATFVLPAGLLLMMLNWIRYDTIFESGYGSQQSAFSLYFFLRDWKDYLFSLDRGIFTYSPLLLISLVFVKKIYRFDKSFLFLLLWMIMAIYFLTASWIGWKGGYCWGNRNLVPIVPLLAIFWGMINFEDYINRTLFFLLILVSFPVQIVGVSLKTHEWSEISKEFGNHPDPFYIPSEIEGSFKLFYEKTSNISGRYNADIFVSDHSHEIDLNEYDSFYGFNFWLVHGAKLFDIFNIKLIGNFVVIVIVIGSSMLLYINRPKAFKRI